MPEKPLEELQYGNPGRLENLWRWLYFRATFDKHGRLRSYISKNDAPLRNRFALWLNNQWVDAACKRVDAHLNRDEAEQAAQAGLRVLRGRAQRSSDE